MFDKFVYEAIVINRAFDVGPLQLKTNLGSHFGLLTFPV